MDACHPQVDIYSVGVVLWELVTKEQALRAQLRDVRVPAECPQVGSLDSGARHANETTNCPLQYPTVVVHCRATVDDEASGCCLLLC